ncbi:MAG: hypothetical protein C5B50_16005 [Verrucomicrobia bacterium]|nr:MAG: hypothetical protein C5B50_16005 [Verrucomicrobiota bacterium]
MTEKEMKQSFGDEYPAAVTTEGMRLPLRHEGRFSRSYFSAEHKHGTEVSRFMDGSASITAADLLREWPDWTDAQRMEFCQSCCWLREQTDFPEILRFIMQHGSAEVWCAIAMDVASSLRQDEAFAMLVRALPATEVGQSSNISQAIALTKHPDAEATLRKRLDLLWSTPGLWESADFFNWVAFDATTCIAHLIELGAPPTDFADKARAISQHVCVQNQNSCRNFLSKHYTWLTEQKNGGTSEST